MIENVEKKRGGSVDDNGRLTGSDRSEKTQWRKVIDLPEIERSAVPASSLIFCEHLLWICFFHGPRMIYLLLVPASSDEKLYFDEIFDQFSVDCHNENDKKNDAGVGGIVFKF